MFTAFGHLNGLCWFYGNILGMVLSWYEKVACMNSSTSISVDFFCDLGPLTLCMLFPDLPSLVITIALALNSGLFTWQLLLVFVISCWSHLTSTWLRVAMTLWKYIFDENSIWVCICLSIDFGHTGVLLYWVIYLFIIFSEAPLFPWVWVLLV